MKINQLIKKQAAVTNSVEKMYLLIVQRSIEKHGIEKARDVIMDEIRKQMPKYVRDLLVIGTNWVNEGEK